MRNPTTLDFAILGLLKGEPMTGYAIRKVFETSALGNYSSSPGAIYPALKRLEQLALIEKKERPGAKKLSFYITGLGRNSLKEWLTRPVDSESVTRKMGEMMLRFAFMDTILSWSEQLAFLEQLKKHLTNTVKGMEQFYQQHSSNMPLNGQLSFQSGLMVFQANLKWSKMAIQTIKKNMHDDA